ncbi:MAG: hypothetical protein QGF09_12880 [Rhodospirillales bacterium]|nr:hypothetical protein [Rhodospirillales bacterium]
MIEPIELSPLDRAGSQDCLDKENGESLIGRLGIGRIDLAGHINLQKESSNNHGKYNVNLAQGVGLSMIFLADWYKTTAAPYREISKRFDTAWTNNRLSANAMEPRTCLAS